MIEIFKTNITEAAQAEKLIGLIHACFIGHEANFDLQDCDNILRVKNAGGRVEPVQLMQFINMHGFYAELLP